MAINPVFLCCVVCGRSHASPFDFQQSEADLAQLDAIHQERLENAAQGWTGPQYISHYTRALLCDLHHVRARELGLQDVPIGEALERLRADTSVPPMPKPADIPRDDLHRQPAATSWLGRCLQWWRGR